MRQLNGDLINRFRNKVNDNHHYVLNKYRDLNGTNYWNIICSAMDWIDVAVDGIPYIKLNHKNQNVASLNLLQLICAMDLIVESVHQLCRVFNMSYPYRDDKSIFKNEKTDDNYFKHIRAMFGVHPVNLKDDDQERYFASWSTPHLKADFSVFIYSNRTDKKEQMYSITIADLFDYTNKRYELLSSLISKIQSDYESQSVGWKLKEIEANPSIRDQINVLMHENKERFGEGEAYWYQLEELKRLFDVDYSIYDDEYLQIVQAYKSALQIIINEIRVNLQEMNIEELENYEVIDPFERISFSYEKGKLFSYLHNPDSDYAARSIAMYALRSMVEDGTLPEIALHYDQAELLLLLNAWQWDQNIGRNQETRGWRDV